MSKRKPSRMMANPIGKRFGVLVVIRRAIPSDRPDLKRVGRHHWMVKCDCGQQKALRGSDFKWNRSRCGDTCTLIIKNTGMGRYPFELAVTRNLFLKTHSEVSRKHGKSFFALSFSQYAAIITKPCTYCGEPTSKAIKRQHYGQQESETFYCNGVDRIDSSKGYVLGNCAPCCTACNVAKNAHTLENFTSWVKQVYTHLILKGDYAEA